MSLRTVFLTIAALGCAGVASLQAQDLPDGTPAPADRPQDPADESPAPEEAGERPPTEDDAGGEPADRDPRDEGDMEPGGAPMGESEADADDGLDPNFTAPRAFLDGVEVRQPALMRASEPQLVGLEQDGNDFRRRTPALARGVFAPLQVDADAAYERRLAMYEAGWEVVESESDARPAPAARVAPRADVQDALRASSWLWSLAVGIGLIAIAVIRRRAAAAELATAERRAARHRRG